MYAAADSRGGDLAYDHLAAGYEDQGLIFGGDRQAGGDAPRAAPEYFEGVNDMLAYFSRVTAAVCNYDARDAGAITRELEQLGATVLDRYTSACTHLLTPYRSGHEYEQALHEGKAVVSYAWLEDCLAARRVLSPTAKVLYSPIQDARGVPGMSAVVVAASGYAGPARADIRELAEAAGATFSGAFTKATTHLVCYRPDPDIYTKALLARLDGRSVEIVNHTWLEDAVRLWRRPPEREEQYSRLGCEVDADGRVQAERDKRQEAEGHAAGEARRAAQAHAYLAAEADLRHELQAQLHALVAELDVARAGAAAEAQRAEQLGQQLEGGRDDVERLHVLLASAEGSRSQLQAQLAAADADRRAASAALDAAGAQQAALTAQFSRSRGDLLGQLEARMATIQGLTQQLEAAHASHAGTQAALSKEQDRHRATMEQLTAEQRRAAGLADQLAAAQRDASAVSKQLEAERRSRLHVLSDCESERRQREHLVRQLDSEQRLRASLQQAVSAKEEARLKADSELGRLSRELDALAAETERLRAAAPREKPHHDDLIPAKLFIDDAIRVLDIDADAGFEELATQVGRLAAETYKLAFEDEDGHRIVLRGEEDLKIALRQFDKSGLAYFKLVLEHGAEVKRRGPLFPFARAGKASTASRSGAGAPPSIAEGSDALSDAGGSSKGKGKR